MKYLFWAIVVGFVWWAWRRTRGASVQQPPGAAPQAQEMVTCTHCGIHLPRTEAVSGSRGPYCSAAHRSAAGDHNPD